MNKPNVFFNLFSGELVHTIYGLGSEEPLPAVDDAVVVYTPERAGQTFIVARRVFTYGGNGDYGNLRDVSITVAPLGG